MAQGPYDYLIKLLTIGNSGVGKSALLMQFSEGEFSGSFISTIGIDFKIKTVEIDGKRVKLQIWDTAGQERFKTITQAYYRGAMGILCVYDITSRESFEAVDQWMENIERHASDDVNRVLVGNKCDCEEYREVSKVEGEEMAERYSVEFFETSAKSATNVYEAFISLARQVKERLEQAPADEFQQISSVDLKAAQKPKSSGSKGGCC